MRKRKQHPELVPAIVNESKPELKVEAVEKTKSEDLLVKSIVNTVLCSRDAKRKHRTKGKEKNRSHEQIPGREQRQKI